jgi:2-keto-4-pentenoate hydratase/2-oxohepta-3-ene-1,7-dioic acid hydratase in catechol pathway
VKLARFAADGASRYGLIEGEDIVELDGPYYERIGARGRRFPLSAVRLLCPAQPGKVVCVGLNYRDHIAEMGHNMPEAPCLFMKPASAVIGPEEAIRCPEMSESVHYEAELGLVVGRKLHRASPAEARAGMLGCTCLNDVTARDLQQRDGQWTRAKSFDTFCPIGPVITDEVDPDAVGIELLLNGERRQRSNTREFVFKSADLVSFMSHVMTLNPGDVIATGTPSGVGPVKPGDVVEVRIEGIGTLRNPVGGPT